MSEQDQNPWASPGWTPPAPQKPQTPGQYPPPQASPPPGAPTDPAYYPQQAHYAPGWTAPVPAQTGPPPRRRDGRRLALLGIGAVVALALVVGGVAGGRYVMAQRPLGEVTKAQTVAASRLSTGHCLAVLPTDGTVSSARVVPCDEPHEAEVIGVLPLTGAEWPGADQVAAEVTAWCEMDATQTELGLRPVVWMPSEAGWAQGDRSGVCLAWDASGTMTGSFTAGDQVTTS